MRQLKISKNITIRQEGLATYLNIVKQYPMISINEEIALSERIQSGDESAVTELVRSNLRFAISVAKQYDDINSSRLNDLIQYANIGLYNAALKFDHTKGFKFISYAVWHIRQQILVGLSELNIIRLNNNRITLLSKINKFIDSYMKETDGIYPTTEAIATGLSIDESLVVNIISVYHPRSLDKAFETTETSTLYDLIENPNIGEIHSVGKKEDLNKLIDQILIKYKPTHQDMLRMKFGLIPYNMEYSFEDIGDKYNLNRERIRQIIAKMTGELAKHKELRNYL